MLSGKDVEVLTGIASDSSPIISLFMNGDHRLQQEQGAPHQRGVKGTFGWSRKCLRPLKISRPERSRAV